VNEGFWKDRSVFLTGHTGFMGGWLAASLIIRGAKVHGYALPPNTDPNFYEATGLANRLASSVLADIGDLGRLSRALDQAAPSVVFHLAAQPLVRYAHANPIETITSNVMGTANLLEAARQNSDVQAIIVVTTDKVYRNVGHTAPYVESDELGGREPYSASKAASEFVIDAWYHSYLDDQGKGVAAIRAGNIFGGGDWAADRLVPDAIRTFSAGKPLVLRNPASTRPWQHVLDPLRGYLTLAENLTERPADFSGKWNFGPEMQDCRPVVDLAGLLAANWSSDSRVEVDSDESVFEERFLALDSSKAAERLGWIPRWPLEVGVQKVVEWHQAQAKGANMWEATQTQIIAMEREETNA
jgi:CDP-glucose 4,6-dehydratase